MKLFTRFQGFDGTYKLEISCTSLKPGEVEELIGSLEGKGFKLNFIGSDSIRGKLELRQYQDIVRVKEQLEKEGFTWSGAISKVGNQK